MLQNLLPKMDNSNFPNLQTKHKYLKMIAAKIYKESAAQIEIESLMLKDRIDIER